MLWQPRSLRGFRRGLRDPWLTRLLSRPFRVDLYLGPTQIGTFRPCLDTGRCPAKAAFLESLLAAYSVR